MSHIPSFQLSSVFLAETQLSQEFCGMMMWETKQGKASWKTSLCFLLLVPNTHFSRKDLKALLFSKPGHHFSPSYSFLHLHIHFSTFIFLSPFSYSFLHLHTPSSTQQWKICRDPEKSPTLVQIHFLTSSHRPKENWSLVLCAKCPISNDLFLLVFPCPQLDYKKKYEAAKAHWHLIADRPDFVQAAKSSLQQSDVRKSEYFEYFLSLSLLFRRF